MIRIHYSFDGDERIFEHPSEEVLIGRPKEGSPVDLDLAPDRQVSRPHARIWVENDGYWIEDLGSTSGTQINGEEIKGRGKHRLRGKEAIQIGGTVLMVQTANESRSEGTSQRADESSSVVVSDSGVLQIGQRINAEGSAFAKEQAVTKDLAQRLALLYELPMQFAEQVRVESLLQTIVERLVAVTPGAKRGTLLVCDRDTNELLLKAHIPHGEPAVSMTLARKAIQKREGFIWQREQDMSASMNESSCMSGMYAPLTWKGQVLGVVCVDGGRSVHFFHEDDLRLLLAVARYAGMALANHRLQEDLLQNAALLSRLLTNFSPKIQENLLKRARSGKLRLGGEKSEVTILCSDIRGFTHASASMDATDVVDMLNEYLGALVGIIFEHGGTVDKFVGDAILAVFGSPDPDPKQQENAIRAAIDMQARVDKLNTHRAARGVVTCKIGIGINCGEVLHGFIGAAERMEFTVIGDAVNKTSRYCDGAQGGEILISPEVHQHVWRMIQSEPFSLSTKHEGTLPGYRLKGLK
jgi:adenylate cyclase